MNRRYWLVVVVGALLALPAAFGKEGGKKEGGKKGAEKGGEKVPLMSLEALEKKVGEPALTEDQKTQITTLREGILKKLAEQEAKAEVKAAKEELAKAKEGGDKDAVKAAAAKLKEVMGGFNPTAEFKAGLEKILSAEQVAKLAAPHEDKGGAKEEKGGKKEKGGAEDGGGDQ